MKVILLESIDRLGRAGETVTVKDGYARNFLIPNKKAALATAGNMKVAQALKAKEAAIQAKKVEEAKKLADKVFAISVTIRTQAGEEEKLYGSVTSEMIANSLSAEGVAIDKKDILLAEPIKKLGSYQVEVKISPEVKATLRVWVVKE